MTPFPTPDLAAEARAVRHRIVEAADAKVLQVLNLVENLPDRGDADRFLAPVRDRLRVLRPNRKMRLARLLFQPLDLLIVDPKHWRADAPLIPRTALMPLAGCIGASVGKAAAAVEREIGTLSSADRVQLRRLGGELWPLAGRALLDAPMPAAWTAQGLPPSAFAPLRDTIAFLLASQPEIADIRLRADHGEAIEHHLTALLATANRYGPPCWGMLVALLLQAFPEAEAPLRAAMTRRADQAGPQPGDMALARAAAWIEDTAALRGSAGLARAADEIASQVALLDRMAAEPTQRKRASELRQALQIGCLARFEAGLQDCIVARLCDTQSIGAMEQDARHLRRMETEARRLGGGPIYDQDLRQAADRVLAAPGLGAIERIRLIEILAGTPLALAAMRKLAA